MNTILGLMSSYAVVVRAGSFTQAATRLGLSKSVVSRHISALEKQLGVQLLYRSTHHLRMTEAGERFYAHCRDLDQIVEQATAVATVGQETPRGLLRITLPQTLVVSPIGNMIARFQERHPEVQCDVRVTSLQVDPIEEGFDLALRIGDLEDSNLLCRKLLDVRLLAVATRGYVKQHGKPRSLRELRKHNCLVYSEFDSRSRWSVATAPRRAAMPQASLSTNSGVLLLHALLAGQGIVVGPEIMFDPHLRTGKLQIVLDAFQPTAIYAVFPSGRFPTARRQAFVDFLMTELRKRTIKF